MDNHRRRVKRHKGDALLASQEAKRELRSLREEIALRSERLLKWPSCFPGPNLRGTAMGILRLPESDFGEAQSLKTIKALAQGVVVTTKKVSEAQQRMRDLGAGEI